MLLRKDSCAAFVTPENDVQGSVNTNFNHTHRFRHEAYTGDLKRDGFNHNAGMPDDRARSVPASWIVTDDLFSFMAERNNLRDVERPNT